MKATRKIILILAAVSAMTLTCCGKHPSDTENPPTVPDNIAAATGANVPDNVVDPSPQSSADENAPSAPSVTESVPEAADSSSEPVQSDPPENPPKTTTNTDPQEPPEENIVVDDIPDTEAMKYLKLLNSKRVHAKLTEMYSFDGDELFSAEREYFINGSEKIYINDGNKTFYRNGTVTFVDYGGEIYYSYPDDGDNTLNFGFDADKYILLSEESSSEGSSELYSVEGEGLASTWEFGTDGRLRVSDRYLNSSAFNYYIFELVESGSFEMDFSIPEDFVEVNAEDYGF